MYQWWWVFARGHELEGDDDSGRITSERNWFFLVLEVSSPKTGEK